MSDKKRIITASVLSCIIFVILISGCTTLNAETIENTPVATVAAETPVTAAPQSTQPVSTKPSVSWKDFYPEYDEQAKSRLIEEAKDEIMRVFPNVDRTTLNGNWVKLGRFMEHDRPTINFKELKYKSGDSRPFIISVDPGSMKIVDYTPDGGTYGQPSISRKEAKAKVIEFIKLAQGEDSIANDPDAQMTVNPACKTGGRPIVNIFFWKTKGGVTYEHPVHAEYDMSRDKIERYSEHLANPELLSGLTTLSPEPDITFDEAIQIYEDLIAKINLDNLDDLDLEYPKIDDFEYTKMGQDNLTWWDDENIVYADNPDPIPLTWYVRCSTEKCRQDALETGVMPNSGGFRIDAHTGEIYRASYGDTTKGFLSLV